MKFRLANKEDDIKLKNFIKGMSVPGDISIKYLREPSYFDFYKFKDIKTEVMIAEDNEKRIHGIGCRSIRSLYINGKPKEIGYLSGLRLSEEARNTTALARGYSYLRKLHNNNPVDGYITTIIEGNNKAANVLTSNRSGLPCYKPIGKYCTYLIPSKLKKYRIDSDNLKIVPCSQLNKDNLLSFIKEYGSKKQFFPVYRGEADNYNIINSIGLDNIFAAVVDGKLAGVMGLWNQENTSQYMITEYSGKVKLIMPLVNFALRIKGYRQLPSMKKVFNIGSIALVCIKGNDKKLFSCLLKHIMNKASLNDIKYLAAGMNADDPLCKVLNRYFHIKYRSNIYFVSWESCSVELLPDYPLYLELGTL